MSHRPLRMTTWNTWELPHLSAAQGQQQAARGVMTLVRVCQRKQLQSPEPMQSILGPMRSVLGPVGSI